jgi:hypothetical protein
MEQQSKLILGTSEENSTTQRVDLPDVERVAEKVHEAWIRSKKQDGEKSRKSETGEELMKPYSELSEEAKDLDRNTVRAVYRAIKELQRG